eukprot:GEMP01030089.1.p1 GENE.GEMP01030089.1~~GEMP01030089.1.p1  ORF type:complete len:449 (+),score=13.03 GEMP01030089.1:36-1349(+)
MSGLRLFVGVSRFTHSHLRWFSSRFQSFDHAKAFARTLQLCSQREWQAWSKASARPHDIPSDPYTVYRRSGWVSWIDFLGNENRKTNLVHHNGHRTSCSQTNATHAYAVDAVVSSIRNCGYLDVSKVEENGQTNVIVRDSKTVNLDWCGIQVKASNFRGPMDQFQFFVRKDCHRLIVVFVGLSEPSRYWVIPGSKLPPQRLPLSMNINPSNPLTTYRVSFDELPHRIYEQVKNGTLLRLPKCDWNARKSLNHQTEHRLHLDAVKMIFGPLEWEVRYPPVHNSIVDFISNKLAFQCKTAVRRAGHQGLQVSLHRYGPMIGGRRTCYPYLADDEIDVFMINVQLEGTLRGVFIISKREAMEHGWLQTRDRQGKRSTNIYPPFVTLRPSLEAKYLWQRQCYVDLSTNLDAAAEQAKALFGKCANHKGMSLGMYQKNSMNI